MQHVTRTIPMMDAYEFVKLQAEMYPSYMTSSNGGYLMEWEGKKWKLDDYRNIDQYNWQDEIFRTAFQHNHNLRLSGGTEGVRYNASLSYYNQDGVLLNSGYERLQARMNTVVRRDKTEHEPDCQLLPFHPDRLHSFRELLQWYEQPVLQRMGAIVRSPSRTSRSAP